MTQGEAETKSEPPQLVEKNYKKIRKRRRIRAWPVELSILRYHSGMYNMPRPKLFAFTN